MIVFSHLRWQFVKQRPQHIMERLSKKESILFVEEPIGATEKGKLTAKEIYISPTITVIQPQVDGLQIPKISALVSQYSMKMNMQSPVLWFYSSAFVDVLQYIPHSLVVYDCMDELSAFKGASPELISKERELMDHATIIFTGGYSLYQKKRKNHSSVYLFPSSVDREHFAKANDRSTPIPSDMRSIPQPIAGFYGVIDERLDLDLIDKLAALSPKISFVLIGPVVKIATQDLPIRQNIYYLGEKSYNELPYYLNRFTVAYMPFALNKTTRFISPTKTLEFIAAQKPIVSTPIYDVMHDFNRVVTIAKTPVEFAQALRFYTKEPLFHTLQRELLQKAYVTRTSWDYTALAMQYIIAKKLQQEEISPITSSAAVSYI